MENATVSSLLYLAFEGEDKARASEVPLSDLVLGHEVRAQVCNLVAQIKLRGSALLGDANDTIQAFQNTDQEHDPYWTKRSKTSDTKDPWAVWNKGTAENRAAASDSDGNVLGDISGEGE
jgi:hypothetical protein